MLRFFKRFLRLFQSRSADQDDPPVYLATAPSEPVARMWQDILRQKNIPALVQAMGGTAAYGSFAGSESRLYVPHSQLERARAVLSPYVDEV